MARNRSPAATVYTHAMRVLLLLPLLLFACTAKPDDSRPLEHKDANDSEAAAALEEAREAQDERFAEQRAGVGPVMQFESVVLGPEEPVVDDTLEVNAKLKPGASPFTEVDFTWYVNGRDLLGVSNDTLDKKKGRFKKFDRIKVVATATDEKGGMTQMASEEILIVNSMPSIVTDISGESGLNGLRLKAEDPDGDALSWSVLEGPPGVTIDRRGTLRVDMRDLAEAYNGEVVVAAEDPDGGRAELHIPVNVNAAEAGRTDEEVVSEKRSRMDGTLEDYAKAQEDATSKIDTMTPEEFDKYMDDQEKKAYK